MVAHCFEVFAHSAQAPLRANNVLKKDDFRLALQDDSPTLSPQVGSDPSPS